MSTTINDQIEHLKANLETAKEILRLYPDATLGSLPDGSSVWMSDMVMPDGVDVVTSVGDPHKREASAHFMAYTNVGSARVYNRNHWPTLAYSALAEFRRTHPDAYAALVAIVSANR